MKHTHQYRRQKIGKAKNYIIYRCMRPGCAHYIAEDFIEGRRSICWRCDEEFTITHKLLRIKPVCEKCKLARKEGVRAQPIGDFDLDKVLSEMGHDDEDPF
jgi:hypothetical protein